ncbi:hypothetical protein [Streptosporangium sp. NPDC004631]
MTTETARIDDAIQETLDAIADEDEYAPARASLTAALNALRDGTTAEAHAHLGRALRQINETCPVPSPEN